MSTAIDVPSLLEIVDRVLASRYFARSPQSARVLRLLAERTQEGALDHVERDIGCALFGPEYVTSSENARFRAVVKRIRRFLTAYYFADGALDPVMIDVLAKPY